LKNKKKSLCNCNDILVIDDEPFNIAIMNMYLSKFQVGIETDTASNGIEALELMGKKL
jgi:CheY-like chemotaxis protein